MGKGLAWEETRRQSQIVEAPVCYTRCIGQLLPYEKHPQASWWSRLTRLQAHWTESSVLWAHPLISARLLLSVAGVWLVGGCLTGLHPSRWSVTLQEAPPACSHGGGRGMWRGKGSFGALWPLLRTGTPHLPCTVWAQTSHGVCLDSGDGRQLPSSWQEP